MTVIQASTVKVSTMADDTLRIVLDISPQFAQEAFALFGMRGAPCVIARLTPEAAIAATQAETVAADTASMAPDDKPKGGELARLAGMFCQQPEFLEWTQGIVGAFGSGDQGAFTTGDAAEHIRQTCSIESRAELDHDKRAAAVFHIAIRRPYVEWRKARGLNA